MSNAAIDQLIDMLSRSGFDEDESCLLSMQLLAWAHLTSNKKIPQRLFFSEHYVMKPEGIYEVFEEFSMMGGLFSQAFRNTPQKNRQAYYSFRDSLEFLWRLSSSGVLMQIDLRNLTNSRFLSYSRANKFLNMPEKVADFLVGAAMVKRYDSVYAPWDSSFAQIASRVIKKSDDVYYESQFNSSIPALISLMSTNSFEVGNADPILRPTAMKDGRLRKFDITIGFPPIGVKYSYDQIKLDLFNRFNDKNINGTVLAIKHALAQTRDRIVLAIPNSFLFSYGSDRDYRKYLIENELIEAVIAFPGGLLDTISIAFSVLIIDPKGGNNRIKFINANDPMFYISKSKARYELNNIEGLLDLLNKDYLDSKQSVNVHVSTVTRNDFHLQVDRYVISDDRKNLNKQFRSQERVELGDLVRTVRPIPFGLSEDQSRDDSDTGIFEIGSTSLPEFGFIKPEGRNLKFNEDVIKRYHDCFLRPLDIILIIKGNVGRVGLVPENVPPPGQIGWVAGQSAIVLRTNGEMDPYALFVQLRSSLGQDYLSSIVSGASIQLIQLRELLKLQIIRPSKNQLIDSKEIMQKEEKLEDEIRLIKVEQRKLSLDIWDSMKYLYGILEYEILSIGKNIKVVAHPTYFSMKCIDFDKERSFADIYVQTKKIRIQILKSQSYIDPKNLLRVNNENWTLGNYLDIKDEDEIEYALSLIKQSYKLVKNKLE